MKMSTKSQTNNMKKSDDKSKNTKKNIMTQK